MTGILLVFHPVINQLCDVQDQEYQKALERGETNPPQPVPYWRRPSPRQIQSIWPAAARRQRRAKHAFDALKLIAADNQGDVFM